MAEKNIVVVEDDADIRNLLDVALSAEGYAVHTAATGHEGFRTIINMQPDLVILDIMLPGMDGIDICREMKKSPAVAHIPVIMLTARGEEIDRIVGLEMGAEDYMVKPFSPRELLLRVKVILKRAGLAGPAGPATLHADGLVITPSAHKVEIDGARISLTATEFRLLSDLLQNRGKVRTREQLLSQVWGYSFEGYARTVDTHIRRLRQKLLAYADLIETIRGVGYRFKEE